eukprot:TRINITY_DN184_c0_g1_i2.p1 TRINITY_DN184_c0_g1~~TRINITY_DN184_c0_g1_i2.p1  ORF type:complete len:110 (-),score=7.20 TRINITY_DN184_c0_g1_i2:180-509(-)
MRNLVRKDWERRRKMEAAGIYYDFPSLVWGPTLMLDLAHYLDKRIGGCDRELNILHRIEYVLLSNTGLVLSRHLSCPDRQRKLNLIKISQPCNSELQASERPTSFQFWT